MKMRQIPEKGPSISITGLSFSFADRPIFSGLNLEIEGGICTCILGPSGCGKSTLLRLISGSAELSCSGTIRLENGMAAKGHVAWMAQKDLLLPWLTVLDNILLGDRLRGTLTAEKREKALALIEAAGLAGTPDKLPGTLSGGMRQRVALLRTLMEECPVILMDEPFSALDALTRVKLQNLTVNLIRGATVLLVTHDPMEALRIGDRIHVLSGSPACAEEVIVPPGPRPRDLSSAGIPELNSRLLDRLLDREVS